MSKKQKKPVYSKLRSHLPQFHLKGRRVLVRVDANVPIQNGKITNDHRLHAILPTLQFIKQQGGKIILATHIGRPKEPTPSLSTKILQPWLENQNFTVTFADTIEKASDMAIEDDILLLENLRFFPGEKGRNKSFARNLARLGEYYVNDAFATMHRNDSSITLTPQAFSPEHRTIGLLVEQELKILSQIFDAPEAPFLALLGGGKVKSKLPVVEALLDKANGIALCPALVFTFTKALGQPVGLSLVDDTLLDTARNIIDTARTKNTDFIFATDYQVAHRTIDGPLSYVQALDIPDDALGVSLGPDSIKEIQQKIAKAKTIFFNCAMGFPHRPETLTGSYELLQAMADAPGKTVIAGGNSVDLVQRLGLAHKMTYISTGGGATLAYISGMALAGLDVFH